jgi:hypothetical protein
LKRISNDDSFIKQALLLHVNTFAAPGVARLRPYSMTFMLREQTVKFLRQFFFDNFAF